MSAMIGVGSRDWVRDPLPPNRTGGSPASGSPVDGSPARGLADQVMGVLQVEQPVIGKEGNGPADVVIAATDPWAVRLFAQDVAQTPPDPAVERREGPAVAVFEVFKPTAQRPVEIGNDRRQ